MRKNKAWLSLLLLPLLALLPLRQAEAVPAIGSAGAPCVALTFDDSPNAALTERLLDGLRERGAHATFFVIGQQIEGQEALLRRMAEEGHQVGNHTWTHRRLDNSGAVGARELARTEEKLRGVLGDNTYWVRPPWGFAGPETLREANGPLLYWTLDTEDWKLLNADRVARRVLDNIQDGDVVLLHDAYASSVDAALRVVDELSAQGWEFVTAEELFDRAGVTPRPGVLYCCPDQIREVK